MSIVLPKLTKVNFVNYEPIFDNDLQIDINKNLFVLLGGNGLGKTTLLQSIIYGLAGSLDSKIDSSPDNRWSRKYFTDRFDEPETAYVEVEFKLGNDQIKIKRGFQSENVLSFILNNRLVSDNKATAESFFAKYLIESNSYDSIDSFRFLVHKLCYLSENRENLVWNKDIQTRILMLIFSDPNTENDFRLRNDQLQKWDSKIRHLNVDINKVKIKIESLPKDRKKITNSEVSPAKNYENEIAQTKSDYLQAIDSRIDLQNSIRRISTKLSKLNSEIEDIQDKIVQNEQAFIHNQISNYESEEAKLAIHKLIHYKICPACSSIDLELFRRAIENLKNESCPLCGTHKEIKITKMAPGLEAELSEKLIMKIECESEMITLESKLKDVSNTEAQLQYNVNKYLLDQPSIIYVKDFENSKTKKSDLIKTYNTLLAQQTDYKIKFGQLKSELDTEYIKFSLINNERIDGLSKLYEKYANEFLGIPCTLIPIDNNTSFVNLKLFVPSFNDKVRNTPESCSEAQRFFLDIAFRMALIEMVCIITRTNATFICETPENALDITYRNNVAEMFRLFMKKKNTLVLTSNIQPDSIAESLLYHIPKENRRSVILNLVEHGKLSNVQRDNIEDFNSIVKHLLNQKVNVSNKQ